MIVVIEEIIPLVVLYAPGILPSTCILPSQRERIDSQRHERQRNTYKLKRDVFAAVDLSEAKTVEGGVNLAELDGQGVKALCG
jgi:LETM1 and EF-hand domain-containing protein 1